MPKMCSPAFFGFIEALNAKISTLWPFFINSLDFISTSLSIPEKCENVGVKIAGVSDDSPAAKAGVLKGDIVTAFNGKPVKNLKDYSNYLKEHQPGDTVTFTIERDGEKKDVKITLGER